MVNEAGEAVEYIPEEEEDLLKVEKVLGVRYTDPEAETPQNAEYLVKWEGMSYHRTEWLEAEELMRLSPGKVRADTDVESCDSGRRCLTPPAHSLSPDWITVRGKCKCGARVWVVRGAFSVAPRQNPSLSLSLSVSLSHGCCQLYCAPPRRVYAHPLALCFSLSRSLCLSSHGLSLALSLQLRAFNKKLLLRELKRMPEIPEGCYIVDRVVAERNEGETREVLVKWMALGYSQVCFGLGQGPGLGFGSVAESTHWLGWVVALEPYPLSHLTLSPHSPGYVGAAACIRIRPGQRRSSQGAAPGHPGVSLAQASGCS
jgi:hypothetical protein